MRVSRQLHTPATLPPGKEYPRPTYEEAVRPQSWPGRFGEEIKPLALPGIETRLFGHAACTLTATLRLLLFHAIVFMNVSYYAEL
jgi:hypothetical protein